MEKRIREHLARAEQNDGPLMIDQIAFVLAHAHRARLFHDVPGWVAGLPKLKAQFEDCLAQDSSPLVKPLALLTICNYIDREDNLGYISDLIRKSARDY